VEALAFLGLLRGGVRPLPSKSQGVVTGGAGNGRFGTSKFGFCQSKERPMLDA
jgi:hypothetical protein